MTSRQFAIAGGSTFIAGFVVYAVIGDADDPLGVGTRLGLGLAFAGLALGVVALGAWLGGRGLPRAAALAAYGVAAFLALGGVMTLVQGASSGSGTLPSASPAAAVSPTSGPSTGTSEPTGELKVITPVNGAVVTTTTVTFAGIAPVGSIVVRDIPFATDEQVIAVDGTWTLDVELDEGMNEVTFRLGDDSASSMTIAVSLTTPVAQATATPTPTVAPTPTPTVAPTPAPTPKPTPAPTPEPTPEQTFVSFFDGTYEVGAEIAPGTYRIREPAGFCYWARLKGFDGSLNEIIANDNAVDAFAVVTIGKSDAGFESSGCGEWTKDLSRVTDSTSQIDVDGTYIVGKDLKAGKWRSSGGDFCYWARLKGFGGTLGSIISNGIEEGRTIVTIRSTDKGFKTTGCGTWTRD